MNANNIKNLLFSDGSDKAVIQTVDQFNQFDRIDWCWVNHFVQFLSIKVIERCRNMHKSLEE